MRMVHRGDREGAEGGVEHSVQGHVLHVADAPGRRDQHADVGEHGEGPEGVGAGANERAAIGALDRTDAAKPLGNRLGVGGERGRRAQREAEALGEGGNVELAPLRDAAPE
eukprot:6106673-Alexandrium_andersonii.AAC.1